MQGIIRDTQKSAFQVLVSQTIPRIIKDASCDLDDEYTLSFSPMDASNSIIVQDESGTEYYSIKAECKLRHKITGEEVGFNAELLKVPVLQELGFKIKGNYMQQLDIYERARGWNFYEDNSRGDCALLLSENKRSIYYQYSEKEGPYVRFLVHGDSKLKVRVSTFFRMISGYSNEELISLFGYNNPYVIQAFGVKGDNSSIYECIRVVARAVLNNDKCVDSTVLNMKRDIEENLFNRRYFSLGSGNAERLRYFQSFGYRANGRILAKTIDCNGYHYEAGIVLSNAELQVIDKLPISELCVESKGKIYHLHKFSTFSFDALGCRLMNDLPEFGLKRGRKLTAQDLETLNKSRLLSITVDGNKQITRRKDASTLTVDDLFTAFGIWTDNLNGYDLHSKQFEITNRVLVPFDKSIERLISNHLSIISNNVKMNLNGVDYNGRLALSINDCYRGINTSAFVDSISNAGNNAGQMADMCNLMAYVSKSNKATAQMGANSATPDMVDVQNLQEGRLDPLDVPESDKIGRVHYRTLLTKLDDEGSLTVPFLRVVNGEVVSKEPVYLTSIEEDGEYIAEWNETFHEPDGSLKKRVRTRCSGNVQTVELEKVTYKEYSPYQNLSPAHSMVPFPGHSAGKRITMACNQVKQAVPLVDGERPDTCAGGESLLGVGAFTVEDILHDYYVRNKHLITEPEETVMHSDLKLISVATKNGSRSITLQVLGVDNVNNQITLEVPYLFRNFESAMFSYKINPKKDNIYHCGEVVAYNNGYSIEKKDIVKCTDFGAQPVDDSVFDRGIALVKNLNVVYKTFGGSAIEDGIVISEKLVYDDSLTHIGLFEIREVVNSGNGEYFGVQKDNAPEYFCSNGLPKVGTYLRPGMEAISKIRANDNKISTKYVYTSTYVEGQVISATIEQTQKGVEAKVLLAQRSYVQSGDKMAGRCGNKGVIARIVPETEMPFDKETGVVADVVLSPLGIPSRQNITQLLEAALDCCMHLEGKIAIVSPYNPNDVDFVREWAERKNVVPKILIDGRTGQEFERPVNFGRLPMYKLHHVSKRKIHSVGMNARLDSTFLQPMKGSKQNGGQSFGEMETWCLESVGATTLLHELFSIQSDDIAARNELKKKQNNNSNATVKGNNCNDLAMQACYRSLGIEFGADTEEGCYTFEPIKDETIRSLYATPITNRSMLHAVPIFGEHRSPEEKAANRDKWGWIDLHTEIIMPIWIYKGALPKIIGISSDKMKSIINADLFVLPNGSRVGFELRDKEDIESLSENDSDRLMTGMEALVWVFKNCDTIAREMEAKGALEDYRAKRDITESSKGKELMKVYRALRDFNQSGCTLKDYIVTSFPVMPQTYRPEVVIAGRSTIPDFDWYYDQIIKASIDVEKDSNPQTQKALFDIIVAFTGIDENKQNSSYKSLLKFFCAKSQKKHHGKIRENMQSKRIMCSGRAAIKPAEDITRSPREMGVPFTMMVTMYAEQLYGYFVAESVNKKLNRKKFDNLMLYLALRDKHRFDLLFQETFSTSFEWGYSATTYDTMTAMAKAFLEGRNGNPRKAIGSGRQPSLHKYSVRAFTPYVVYDNMIHLHPLLCRGYNADFDGDQMYIYAVLTEEAIDDALEKISPAKDFVLPKDGSIVLEHSQDIVLGVYCATMLKDNSEKFRGTIDTARYYNSIDALRTDILSGDIRTWNLVVYTDGDRRYVSTAGRIFFNSLIPGAFTDEPFTNPLSIAGLKSENYRELKYDGIVCSGKGSNSDTLHYYNLPAICKDIYEQYPMQCIDVYQAITEFGFTISDKVSVSLSLYDFDIDSSKDEMLAEVEKVKNQIEQDYQDGLISDKDKRTAVIAIYGDSQKGVNNKILKDLLDNLPRNNNIFIMMDSGARGNKSQLMHMRGAIGVLQKSKTEDLETSVTKNYYSGLNSFDVHLTSYSARIGVASTQNETKNAGYATHKVVYMASGIQVVENDCGTTDYDFDIEWDEHDESKDRFVPSKKWYDDHLLDKCVSPEWKDDYALTDNGVFTDGCYTKLVLADGFHQLHLTDGILTASIFDAKGSEVLDTESRRYLCRMPRQYVLDIPSIEALLRQKVGEVETVDGIYHLRYNMTACCKSLLCKRVAYDLPYLRNVYNRATNENVDVITDNTIKFIEDNKLDRIKARTVLKCRSKHGICAHCFGLQFSNDQLPEVGSYVGTESAQSIAEPASQLTLNVINKGGASGSSEVSSGVQIFDDLLAGSKPKGRMDAVIAPNSGYLCIDKLDNMATISIMPSNLNSILCRQCLSECHKMKCPKLTGETIAFPCMLKTKIPYNTIIQHNGEWVNAGDPITSDMIYPDSIVSLGENCTQEDLHVRRQRVWIDNYYNTFKDSGVIVYARHFELLANVQNRYVCVLDPKNTDLELGKVYEFNQIRDKLGEIRIKQMVAKRDEVTLWNSGALAALSFENVAEVAAKLVTSGYKASTKHNHSLISSLAIGEDLKERKIKNINKPNVIFLSKMPEKQPVVKETRFFTVENTMEDSFSLGDLDLSVLTAFDSAASQATEEIIAESENHVGKKQPVSYEDFLDGEEDFAEAPMVADEKPKLSSDVDLKYKDIGLNKAGAF